MSGPPPVTAAVLLRLGLSTEDPATRRMVVLAASGRSGPQAHQREGLEAAGHQVVLAQDWPGARDILQRVPVDVLLLDQSCPGVRGNGALRRLRGLPPPLGRLPVVLTADIMTTPEQEAARQAGADVVLTRPFAEGALEAALREAVAAWYEPPPLDPALRAALREEIGDEALAARDQEVLEALVPLLDTLMAATEPEVLQAATQGLATLYASVGAARAAAAATALAQAPEQRDSLYPPLLKAIMATRMALFGRK